MEFRTAVYVLGAIAAVLVGFSKTGVPGAGLPAVALMAEAFPGEVKLSVGALLPLLIVGDLFAIRFYRRHADWQRLGRLFPYVVLGMVPGYLVLRFIDGEALRRLLGAIILLLLLLHQFRRLAGWSEWMQRPGFAGFTGVLAGFGTTVGNAAGPVMSLYLVSQRLDKHQFLGTSAWFFFLVNASKVPFYAAQGMITPRTLGLDALLAPLVVGGALLGAWVLRQIPQNLFDLLVFLLAAIAGLRMAIF